MPTFRNQRKYLAICDFEPKAHWRRPRVILTESGLWPAERVSYLAEMLPFYCPAHQNAVCFEKERPSQHSVATAFAMSGREDSNLRPPEPHSESDAISAFSKNAQVPLPQAVIKPAFGGDLSHYILI
jgi:hypothetical protein